MRESHSYIPPLASRLVPSHNLRMWRLICVPNKHAGAPQLPSVLTHKLWLPTTNISGSPWTMTRSPFHEGDFCCCVCSVGLLSWPSKAAFCTRCWYCHLVSPWPLANLHVTGSQILAIVTGWPHPVPWLKIYWKSSYLQHLQRQNMIGWERLTNSAVTLSYTMVC